MRELFQAFLIAVGIVILIGVVVGLIVLGSWLIEAGAVIPGAIILLLILVGAVTWGVYYVRHD